MEEDAGVEEYNSGRTLLVVQCWCLWRRQRRTLAPKEGGWSTTLAPRRRWLEEHAGAEEEDEDGGGR